MKKFMFLGVCFMLLLSLKSKAQSYPQITPFSTLPGGATPGYMTVGYPPSNAFEDDQVFANTPSGMTCAGISLIITAYGDLGDEVDLTNAYYSSATYVDFQFNPGDIADAFPGENFYIVYQWECDYVDNSNYNAYIQGETDVWGGL